MKNVNIFKEKKQIYRLLSIAMAEDGDVNIEEEMAIATVLMYHYCRVESGKEKSMRLLDEKGFSTFWKHITRTNDNSDKNDSVMLSLLGGIREKINLHRIKFEISDFQIIDAFNYQYKQKNIQLSQELKEDLLGTILLEQLSADAKREHYRECLLSTEESNPELYVLKTTLLAKIKEDKRISENLQGATREENCQTLEEYYEIRIRPLVQEYAKLYMQCLLLIRQSLEELLADTNGSVGKSIFMNVNGLSKQEKAQELKEMVYVIKSDRSIMDREREAFRVVCKIFRVKGSSDLWRGLLDCSAEELLNSNVKTPQVHYKGPMMAVNDFSNIQQSICFFDVKGKILSGTFHALQHCLRRRRDNLYLSDKQWSNFAVWTFGISALILYFFVADLVNRTDTRSIIFCSRNLMHFLENSQELTKWLGVSVLGGFIVFSLRKWRGRLKKNIKKYRIVLFTMPIIIVIPPSIKCCFETTWSDIVGTFFIPLTLVAMMLSIEWLIFMRQEYSGFAHDNREPKGAKTRNTSILIVLVCAAIMIDVCLGIVELISKSYVNDADLYEVGVKDYVAKIASALILGCICFFAGKFLDMYRIQQLTDVTKMQECIKALDKRMNEKSTIFNWQSFPVSNEENCKY